MASGRITFTLTPLIQTIVDAALDATAIVTQDLRVQYYNRSYATLAGMRQRDMQRTPLVGMCHSHFDLDSCDAGNCVALQAFSRCRPIRVDEVSSRKLNLRLIVTSIPLLGEDASPVAVIEAYRDVTAENRVQERFRTLLDKERRHSESLEEEVKRRTLDLQKSLEELKSTRGQLVHAEKMSSLGRLVAGVAHELNNPLNFVIGNLDFVDEYCQKLFVFYDSALAISLSPNEREEMTTKAAELELEFIRGDLVKVLSTVRTGIDRVSRIISDLKTFSRQEGSGFRYIDLNLIISSTLNLASPRATPRAKIARELTKLPPVRCNSAQVGQAIMNLLTNSLDAIVDQGTIIVRSRLEENTNMVTIEVEDDGQGMAPDALEKIFEPFFTTKDVGKGAGLGLSIAFGIAQGHGGKLEVESSLGKGSVFRLKLPVDGPPTLAAIQPAAVERASS